MSDEQPQKVREILTRIEQRPSNPVTRARIMVEQEVPVSRRGPGWDRHWRELEAYLESDVGWRSGPEPSVDQQTATDKKRADPKTSP